MAIPIGESQADHQENPLIILSYQGIFLKTIFPILLPQKLAQSENLGDLIQGNHILKKRFIPVRI